MLEAFRHRGLKNVVYAVLIVVMAVVFVINFQPGAQQQKASLSETCVANVRGTCITPKDFNGAMRVLVRQVESSPYAQYVQQKQVRQDAIDGLIERELLVAEARRLGITASEEEVDSDLLKGYIRISVPVESAGPLSWILGGRDVLGVPQFFDTKTKSILDEKKFTQVIKGLSGRSTYDFRAQQLRELIAAKVRDVIRSPVRISEAEALDSYLREKSNATISYVRVRESFVARYMVQPTPEDLTAFKASAQAEVDKDFEARKGEDLPKAGRVRHILAGYGGQRGKPPTEEQRLKAQAKAAEAWGRLQGGEAFSSVARDLSDDPGSKDRGGGYDSMDGFVAEFRNAADALKPGQTTPGAVETDFGYHIITKDDPAKTAEVEAAIKSSIVRSLFVKKRAMEVAKTFASQLEGPFKASSGNFDDALTSALKSYLKAPFTVPLILRDSKPASDAGAPVEAGAVADASVPSADASDPKKPGTQDKGATGKPGKNEAADKSKDVPKGPEGKGFTVDTDPERPKLETSGAFNQGGDPFEGLLASVKADVIKFAFSAKAGDSMSGPVLFTGGYALVRSKEVKKATREEFEKDRESAMAMLLGSKQREALIVYVKRLRDAAKAEIKIDGKYFRDPSDKDGGAPAAPMDEE